MTYSTAKNGSLLPSYKDISLSYDSHAPLATIFLGIP